MLGTLNNDNTEVFEMYSGDIPQQNSVVTLYDVMTDSKKPIYIGKARLLHCTVSPASGCIIAIAQDTMTKIQYEVGVMMEDFSKSFIIDNVSKWHIDLWNKYRRFY